MDYTPVFLFSLLQVLSLSTAAPVPTEAMKMKSKVRGMADQLVFKLNRDFQQFTTDLPLSPPAEKLDGFSSVKTVLEDYNRMISDTVNKASQIKKEISSLTGYLDHWRQGHCNEQAPKPPVSAELQELQNSTRFALTVTIEALMRVKQFLNLLLQNLDQLEAC